MPRGYRGPIYAIGLIAVLCAGVQSGKWIYDDADRLERVYEDRAKQKAEAYANRAHIAAERRCVPLPAQAERDCIREEAQAARQGQHDEYDLQAQLVTSAWTRAMGIAAIIAMAAGIFGIGLVFVTFRETRVAAAAARDTYNAFVALERATLVPIIKEGFSDPEGKLCVRLRISNIGRSTGKIFDMRFAPLDDAVAPKEFPGVHKVDRVLKPGDSTTEEVTAPIEAADCKFLGGYVEYGSTLGTAHKAYFCAAISKRPNTASTIYVNQYAAENAIDPQNDLRWLEARWPADT